MAETTKTMETMLATENQQEATEVMAFLGELAPEEKKDFLVFIFIPPHIIFDNNILVYFATNSNEFATKAENSKRQFR